MFENYKQGSKFKTVEDVEDKVEKISPKLYCKKTKRQTRERRKFKGLIQNYQMFQKVRMEKRQGKTF